MVFYPISVLMLAGIKDILIITNETDYDNFIKLFKYALEGITAFSTAPLLISSAIGLLFCLISFLMILVIIIK